MTQPDSPRSDRLHRMLVPALLITIASHQIYLAKTHDLTPWKGGGFGMFSTVDDPTARWVRCYAIADGRESAVKVPNDLDRAVARVRAMPSREGLRRLATNLAQRRFVNGEYDKNVEAKRRLTAGPALRATNPPPVPACEAVPAPPFRIWDADEREPRASELARVQSVRLELWRLRFDLANHRMVAWKALTAVAPAQAAEWTRAAR